MLAEQIAFAAVAASMVIAAIRVVTAKNVVHAALYLVVVLAGVAANYVLLAAEFVFVVQLIVYIGAIVVLLVTVLRNGFGSRKLPSTGPLARTADVGLSIFQTYVIPFEVVSVLLLAALVGAVVIARRD